MHKLKILLLAFPLLLTACGSGTTVIAVDSNNGGKPNEDGNGSGVTIVATNGRALHGIEAGSDVTPQLVQISRGTGKNSTDSCSGVAIAPGAVLTAAHCVSDGAAKSIISNGFSYSVDQVILHPGYSAESRVAAIFNDVAIVKSKQLNLPTLPILTSLPLVDGENLELYATGTDESGRYHTVEYGSADIDVVTQNHLISAPSDGTAASACSAVPGGPAVLGFTDLAGAFSTGIVGIVSSSTTKECVEGSTTLFVNLQNKSTVEFIASAAPGVVFN